MPWKEELFEERSFWQVYTKARKVTGSQFNRWIIRSTGPLLITLISLRCLLGDPYTFSLLQVVDWVRNWAEIGVAFATSILGFLIAGFSIFASVTNKKLFIALAHIKYRDTDISRLKFIFFNFIIVFIHYLAFLSACLFIELLLPKDGLLTETIFYATSGYQIVLWMISATGFVILGTWFVAVLLMLKSFIWNLYQAVLLAIATEAEFSERRE